MNYTLSPNMSLILPTVGVEPGPTWAQDLNNSLSLIDAHDHSTGNGIPVTPAGLSISSDLSFLSNNSINLRSTRFTSQTISLALGTDLNCFYVLNGDAYFIDGSGNNIRFTQSGSIAGASGSITGLTSPASVTYVAGTPAFVFQSDVNKAANLDAGAITLRKITTSSPGITIAPPSALASDYTLALPLTLPGTTSIMQLSPSGNISASNTLPASVIGTNLDITTFNATTVNAVTSNLTNVNITGTFTIGGPGGVNLANNVTALVLNGGVYPGTTVNAKLAPYTDTSLSVQNNAGGDDRTIVVSYPGAVGGSMLTRGIVNAAGTKIGGEGFTSSFVGPNTYVIAFSPVFSDTPAVVCSSLASVAGSPNVQSISASGFTIAVVGASTVAFSFIAMGQR